VRHELAYFMAPRRLGLRVCRFPFESETRDLARGEAGALEVVESGVSFALDVFCRQE